MPRIALLPDALVNQIAAGEVVERPASVVKELVENALDAGAAKVAVEIEGGGVARIAVVDDGSGMEPDDARLALERHATSKIRTLDDLSRIASLGFRGEALPSIASVSRFTLTTSPDSSGLGTEVLAERGAAPVARPARRAKGTTVVVEDLFGNVPARRKFLKSPEAETRAVARTLSALALSRPDVAFSLRSGPRELLDLPAALGLAARFVDLVGASTLGEVLPVSFALYGMTLTGAVSRPEVTFASRTNQWFFVNGRAAKDGAVAHAAQLAAREVLRDDRFPAFALFIACDPAACDVNVHPQKLEVRFRDSSAVHSLVHRGLAEALTGGKGASPLAGSSLSRRRVGGFGGFGEPPAGSGDLRPEGVSFVAESAAPWGGGGAAARSIDGLQAALLVAPAAEVARGAFVETTHADSPIGTLRLLGQYRDSFLLAEGAEGLVLVDQHVAHERVRYERILARLAAGGAASQSLLLPVTFEASPEEAALMREADALLADAGFVVSELSGRAFVVSAVPSECGAGAVVPFLRDFLSRVAEAPGGRTADRREALAASLACRGAITVNTRLAPEEATRLLADLAACRDPFTCPHGRPILLTLSQSELEKRFGRRS